MGAQVWVLEICFAREAAAGWKAYVHDFSGILDLAEDALQMRYHGVTVKVTAPPYASVHELLTLQELGVSFFFEPD